MKSPAQLAYEKELSAQPRYHNGSLRPDWDHLDPIARDWRETVERKRAALSTQETEEG